jgi:hypothetical protein
MRSHGSWIWSWPAKLFIDLHTVAKRSVRASVEQYSLKALEAFHAFTRRIPLEEAGRAMRAMQHALETERTPQVGDAVKHAIVLYIGIRHFNRFSNRDCLFGKGQTEIRLLLARGAGKITQMFGAYLND